MSAHEGADRMVRRLLPLAAPLLLAATIFYLLYELLLSHVEGDQAYLLYAAQRVLDGVTLDGPRLIETNPPLIVWFSEFPAGLARLLHVRDVSMLRFVVLGMWAASAAWGLRILRIADIATIFGSFAGRLLAAATFFLILITQPSEFGQREQLLLILFLPYLLAVGTGVVERLRPLERMALGLAAGLAICFKPHHLLTIVCLEAFLAVYGRSLRRLRSPELLASIAAGAVYIAAVRVVTPTYLPVIMPLLQSTYWALGRYSFAAMALQIGRPLTLPCLTGAVFWLVMQKRLTLPRLTGAFLASAFGATLAYFIQHTGWYHQGFPAVALLEIAAVWILADALLVRSPDALRTARASRAAWIALPLCALLAFAAVARRARHRAPGPPDLTSELASVPSGTTVYAFTVGMSQFPQVLDRRLVWGSRFAHLWMLPAIRNSEVAQASPVGPEVTDRPFVPLPAARVAELASLQREETTDDLLRTRPAIIFVERCDPQHACDSFTAPFNAVEWFSRDPRFAQMWQTYRYQRAVDAFDVYVRQ